MNILLIIMGAGLILAAAFILKGRKKQTDRGARYRAPRPALKLDRGPAASGRLKDKSPLLAKARPPSSPAAPILLGLVLVLLSLWLAAAYLRPSAESAETGNAAIRASSPPPPQVGALAGQLNAAPEANKPPATPPPPLAGGALAAAQADGRALSQVGLMPTNRQEAPSFSPAPASPPAAATKPLAETKPPAAAPPQAKPAPSPPSQPAASPAPADSSLARALSAPPGGTASPAASGDGRSGILSGTEGFTIHLASFLDQANAENFRAKLTAAGESATISEIEMGGRRWHRVMSGRFTTRTAADAHGRELRRRGLINETEPFIVKPINSN